MANSRIARFVMEVPPPQFVSVLRRRTREMLDTIKEEEREGVAADAFTSVSKCASSSPTSSSSRPPTSAGSSSSAAPRDTNNPKHLLKEVQSCHPIFGH